MAINIYREPDETSTPYNPIYFDVSSDLATITGMIADVYVNSSLVGSFSKEPLIDTSNTFRFDVGDVLKKHFTRDITLDGIAVNALRQSSGSALNYHIRAFEVSDNGLTFDTSWSEEGAGTNYAQSTTLKAFDGIIDYNQELSDYICSSDTSYILTNRPFITGVDASFNTSKILRGQEFELGFLSEQTTQFRYKEFDANFSIILDTSFSNITPTNNKAFFQHNGVYSSNAKFAGFRVRDNVGNAINSPYIFEVVDACEDDNIVFWKNQYGAYDYYTFKGNYKKSANSRQKTYDKRLNYNNNNYDRGETVRVIENKETFTIYTMTESTKVINWLHEILRSTDVYIYSNGTDVRSGDSKYLPIIVSGASSASLNDDEPIVQFSLNYRFANAKQSHLG